MKKCSKCGLDKESSEFGIDKRLKSGLKSYCKSCHKVMQKIWVSNNRDVVRESSRRFYSKNSEKWADYEKKLSPEKKEKKRNYIRDYYKKNREQILEKNRKRYATLSKEEKMGRLCSYYENNKEKICERSRLRYSVMSEEQKARNVERVRNWRHRNKEKANAWSAVGNALINGDITKPDTCSVCNEKSRIHAHHEDYSKPLDVQWLCHKCHMKLHYLERRK